MPRTWFVTGAARGLGRAFVDAALERGDRVVATARSTGPLEELAYGSDQLLVLPLDVTDTAAVTSAVHAAAEHFGGLDIVVNNAGAGDRGAVEELPESALRSAMDVNFFGAVAVTRAALPVLREQGRGHVVQISSMGGLMGLPLAGAYIASKWALEGLTEALSREVAGLGIAVTLVEPAAFATEQGGGSVAQADQIDAYRPLRDAAAAEVGGPPPGDPADAAQALLRVVDAPSPPLRVIFGSGAVQFMEQVYADRLAGWHDASALFG